jgi:3-isopropylmalate dehydrogenase
MNAKILLLPGDGVGPEVTAAAWTVLRAVAERFGHDFAAEERPIGAVAIDLCGQPLPDETLAAARQADAILLGAVGDPRFNDPSLPIRPEQALLQIRQELGLFANLRPVPIFKALAEYAPLKNERLEGVDLLFVRELTGGLYFGQRAEQGTGQEAFDTMKYSVAEVERVGRIAFELARKRRKKLTSVDKANVLASMRLWRRTISKLAADYPDVQLEHQLVDSCAMRLLTHPSSFDVIVTENMFGDILSDEAGVLAGSLGLLPSASLGEGNKGLYEPVHGSAPDIAGKGIANPIGAILSAALLLRHSLGLEEEASTVERAVARVLEDGVRTADLASPGARVWSTVEVGSAVARCPLNLPESTS